MLVLYNHASHCKKQLRFEVPDTQSTQDHGRDKLFRMMKEQSIVETLSVLEVQKKT